MRASERALVDFFNANPDEELSVVDAATKLGSSARTALNSLSTLAGAGILERVSIYRLREVVASPGGLRAAE